MEREAAATLTNKADGDTGSTQRLDELASTSSGRMNTRQNPADDRTVKEELMEKQKLRSVVHEQLVSLRSSSSLGSVVKLIK